MSLQHLQQLGTNFLKLAKGRMRLFNLEFQLAKASLVPFILLMLSLIILVSTTWISLMSLIAYCIYYNTSNLFVSLGVILLFNLFMVAVVGNFLYQLLQQLQFTRTRKYFKKLTQDSHDGQSLPAKTAN